MSAASHSVARPVADPRWAAADRELPQPLLVLMYHGLHEGRDDAGHFDPRYSVRPAAFAEQMSLLGRERRRVLATPETPESLDPSPCRAPAVLISFDDGDVSNASVALPCLVRNSLPAVFFVTSQNLGQPGWLASEQLSELAEAGMRIGSHGASHRFLSGLDSFELCDELAESRDALQRACGSRVDWLALPGGRGAGRECEAARDWGYSEVFGSVPGINGSAQQGLPLQRVAITRDLDRAGFAQILAWRGKAVSQLCWRHRLLSLPRALLGDARYDQLRNRLVR